MFLTFDARLSELGFRREGCARDCRLRTGQRHFLQATGITPSTIRQIERARHATNLLKQGVSILDTVHEGGYFDQAHLTPSLKYQGETEER
jgi:methylphosphotriester-DNA--protein-cysteine methyltransferase